VTRLGDVALSGAPDGVLDVLDAVVLLRAAVDKTQLPAPSCLSL